MMPLELFPGVYSTLDKRLNFTSSPIDLSLPPPLAQHDTFNQVSEVRSLEDLGQEIRRVFAYPCDVRRMLQMSFRMKEQYYHKLRSSTACMLPSFCHSLPTGQENGTYVALDVGGSTLRVALVELNKAHSQDQAVSIKRISAAKIDESVRRLSSMEFFRWMAEKIRTTLEEDKDVRKSPDQPIPVGLAWSFPIEQTSSRSGRIQGMGKGFSCHHGSIGKDVGQLIENACQSVGLVVRVDAVINDSLATLLSQSYIDPSTSMGLITGTGMNAAAFLPVSRMDRHKFGNREESWFAKAERVITNTELSMFGKGILPETRWDECLNHNHQIPDFQPLEYMTTGRYLGEILRLIILEAVEECDLFSGLLPPALMGQYTLDTALLAMIEEDQSWNLSASAARLQAEFGLSNIPSSYEMAFLRTAVEAISQRASAYLAVAIHALWVVQKETEVNLTTPMGTPKTSIACNGSVILKYPGFKSRCEDYIAHMISVGSGNGVFNTERVVLEPTDEAAIVGAAVAVAMAECT